MELFEKLLGDTHYRAHHAGEGGKFPWINPPYSLGAFPRQHLLGRKGKQTQLGMSIAEANNIKGRCLQTSLEDGTRGQTNHPNAA